MVRDGLACLQLDWKQIDEELDETTKHCFTGPWQSLHFNFAGPFQGQMFLIVVDAYSKYLDVIPMSTATSSGKIKALRRLFSTFRLPLHIVRDNGSQLTSFELKIFGEEWNSTHMLSSSTSCNKWSGRTIRRSFQNENDTRAQRFLFLQNDRRATLERIFHQCDTRQHSRTGSLSNSVTEQSPVLGQEHSRVTTLQNKPQGLVVPS